MANINYNIAFDAPNSENNQQLLVSAIPPLFPIPQDTEITVTNTKDSQLVVDPQYQENYTLYSADIYGSGNPFLGGVYHANAQYLINNGGGGDDYAIGNGYFLNTIIIDAGIAAYAPTNATEAANLVWMQYLRAQIDIAFTAENYTLCNTLIGRIEATLIAPETITTNSSVSLIDRNTLRGVMQNDNELIVPLNSPINYVENTLLNTYKPFSSDFLVATASGSVNEDSDDVFAIPYYADGVHIMYNFAGNNFSEGTIRLARYMGYAVVTTTITEQFAIYAANYDKTDSTQQNYYDIMLAAFATIATLSSDVPNNYVDINSQISIIQEVLSYTFEPTIKVTLPSKDEILVQITSAIANVTYSSQKLVLTNCGDATQEYILENSFPANYADVSKSLNSNTILFGSQYSDSVYQASVSWNSANSQVYSGSGYVLVTTQIDCAIKNIIAKSSSCKALMNKKETLMFYRNAIGGNPANKGAFDYEDYSLAIDYIKKCLSIINQSGCNCGC